MTSALKIRIALGVVAVSAFTFTAAIAGPSAPGKPQPASDDDGPDAAKLWSQNCVRCHNMRPGKSFSNTQWDVIVHHMRVRGNLTGSEARLIVEFIKDAK